MNIINRKKQENLVLTFIDEQTDDRIKQNKHIFVIQSVKDDINIDFTQMLQRQWNVQTDQIIFNSKTKIETERARKMQKTIKNFKVNAQNGGLVSDRFKNKGYRDKLLNVQTIFPNPFEQEEIDQFLQFSWFKMSTRISVILYIIGLAMTDYSFRLENSASHYSSDSILNAISLHFQLFANCAFSVQILLKMFSKHLFFANPWNILNLIGSLACWISIFLDLAEFDGQPIFHILFILKILLGIRIIEIFEFIKGPFESFITTIPELGKIFFPYLIFVAMYSVLGLILFMGANQFKCRQTISPIDGMWPEVQSHLCGSNMFECEVGYCGNPYQYNLPYNTTEKYEFDNQFGLVSYDNIGSAFLTTYHYIFLSNWTNIMFKFSKFMNPYLTVLYFFTSAIFLFFIMSNLNMITMCKAFIEKQKQKQKFKLSKQTQKQIDSEQNIENSLSPSQSNIYQILKYCSVVLLISNSIIILIQYEGMTQQVISRLNKIDFYLTIFCSVCLILKAVILKLNFIKDKFLILDFITIFISLSDILYCGLKGQNALDPHDQIHRVLRGLKIIRIIKLIYFMKTWFIFQKTILKIFIQTLNTVKSFFLLLFSVILIFAFMGQNLFANKIRFEQGTDILNIEEGESFVSNFDNIYKALISVTLLLENQHWTQIMYMYYKATGWIAIAYFTIIVFILHLMLTRLFIAIFLCNFRRNLEKKNDYQLQGQETSKMQLQNAHHTSKTDLQLAEILQNEIKKTENRFQENQSQLKQQQKLFWVFQRDLCFFQFLRACYNSLLFHRCMLSLIALHCLSIMIRTSQDNQTKTRNLDIVERISLYFYILQLVIGIVGFGFYWGHKTYLKETKMNYLNLIVAALVLISQFNIIGQMECRIIRRFAILKILTLFTRTGKETTIVLDSISAISSSFVRMIGIYIFLLIISCLLPLKLGKDRFFSCENYSVNVHQGVHSPQDYRQCTLIGGDWVEDPQKFSNIFESIALMYQIVTSQSWIYYIQKFEKDRPWDIFFVLNFFIYNICLLNIFVGLTVETYLSLKDKAYKLNLLRPNQRMWLLIRNSINELIPIPMMKQPEGNSKFRKLAYNIISQPIYENCIDVLAYINVLVYALKYYRADSAYLYDLDLINTLITAIFMLDTILKLQLHWNFFYLDNSKVEFCGFVYFIFYAIISSSISFSHETKLALKFIGAIFLVLRCKKLIFRFTWCKTLLNSVIDVLPKCLIIGALLAVILFFYISIGIQLFKYTKPTSQSDGYITGFNNAFTSLVTLLKIVSNQTWFLQVSAFVRGSSPADVCFTISNITQGHNFNDMGCGSKFAYFYFITFHMLIALLVLNLLIATMTAAYDENYQKQYKSVNIFQLQDCLKLWQKYDTQGTGVIPYKKFWRLSSQIAILFGISKKKLIKGKQKFLEELDIQVCQSIDPKHTSVLCYKFHDVLTQFSKIKLTVSKTDNSQESGDTMDFEIHPMIQHQIKDYVTKTPQLYEHIKTYKNLRSGQMKYFFGLLRKMRAWRIVAKKKDSSIISKLSHIIKVALQKKQKEELEITRIRNSMTNFLTPIIS